MDSLRWLCVFLIIDYIWCQTVKLTIPLGTLTGRNVSTPKGTPYYSFQKIPFAEPPVGNLRFQPPVPKKNSKKVYDNTNDDVVCYQSTYPLRPEYQGLESEDCLYLNIYTPRLTRAPSRLGLPVLVHYYGGGFMLGAFRKLQYGPDFMIDKDIIVALVNYRLGPFGYLSTNDTIIPGNYGLKDQLLGLKWIYKNIRYFGGNPSKITIGGESAGSASVSYLLMAKKARGYFRGAIMESGSALNQWGYQKNARNMAFQLAKIINPLFCSTNSTNLRNFLTGVTAQQLKQASITLRDIITFPVQILTGIIFTPVIEVEHKDALITQKQYVAYDKGDVNRVPLFIGYSSEEGISFFGNPTMLALAAWLFDASPDLVIPSSLQLKLGVNRTAVAKEIKQIYVPSGNFLGYYGRILKFFTDTLFTRGIIKTAELMSKWSKVYFYQFSYSGIMGGPTVIIEGADRVAHVGEYGYIWYVNTAAYSNTNLSKFPKDDIRTHDRLVNMWTNFVKNLNPSIPEAKWPDVRAQGNTKFLYMNINTTLTIENQPRPNTYPKWNNIFLRDGVQPFSGF